MNALTPHQALRRRAIACLARREHSRAELVQKLAAHAQGEAASSDEINAVLDELIAQGLQSDRRFAEGWVRSKAARFGAARLRHDLLAKGVAAELVEAVLRNACAGDEGDEAARARALWQHRFGQPASDVRERAKQARFLQGRGFSSAVIGGLLREVARA